jgi:hypothetical protein
MASFKVADCPIARMRTRSGSALIPLWGGKRFEPAYGVTKDRSICTKEGLRSNALKDIDVLILMIWRT